MRGCDGPFAVRCARRRIDAGTRYRSGCMRTFRFPKREHAHGYETCATPTTSDVSERGANPRRTPEYENADDDRARMCLNERRRSDMQNSSGERSVWSDEERTIRGSKLPKKRIRWHNPAAKRQASKTIAQIYLNAGRARATPIHERSAGAAPDASTRRDPMATHGDAACRMTFFAARIGCIGPFLTGAATATSAKKALHGANVSELRSARKEDANEYHERKP